jgi:CubicO group peptidase (beta-lactamase class C family)
LPSGLPDYFHDEVFTRRLRKEPSHAWRPVELVDHAAAHGTPSFPPGQGFGYSDTGYVVVGILVEQVTGRPLHLAYRELIFDPLGMDATWLEGHEPARSREVAHHYADGLDLTAISPTIARPSPCRRRTTSGTDHLAGRPGRRRTAAPARRRSRRAWPVRSRGDLVAGLPTAARTAPSLTF